MRLHLTLTNLLFPLRHAKTSNAKSNYKIKAGPAGCQVLPRFTVKASLLIGSLNKSTYPYQFVKSMW